MKKKIVILGSTGSIGKNTIDILKKNKKKFDVKILSTNKNINLVVRQAKEFNVKNVIINHHNSFLRAKKKYKNYNISFYNSFEILDKILTNKEIFYTMISIVGIDGLDPCLKMIKLSQNIGIANKESLICGWSIIQKEIKRYNTKFIPIDSEHFSIYSLTKNENIKSVEKIYLTASGGPFLNFTKSQLKKVTLQETLKHPNWIMGPKISVDSATMMNKVFEVIEAKNIFSLNYRQIKIIIHPKSYIHGIAKFNNGITKLLLHDNDMKIPIHNSLFENDLKKNLSSKINFEILNNLNFKNLNQNQFPLTKILNTLPEKGSLYETALITINDFFVKKFLQKKISYLNLIKLIYNHLFNKEFTKLKIQKVRNINDIYNTRNYVLFKLNKKGI
ncbi:1-deoxy-D-xylulose-5-phosphate reductoisomerase [Candidatus Pelagibacter communis]|uniref:1-deoxy-D-xylulose-5-phosphate reductoisomerase n=1 Tax=Candidatus Pelagibacter TaxID=198251 RepID=UPI003EE20425